MSTEKHPTYLSEHDLNKSICIRGEGNLAGNGFFLNPNFAWTLAKDDAGAAVIVPTYRAGTRAEGIPIDNVSNAVKINDPIVKIYYARVKDRVFVMENGYRITTAIKKVNLEEKKIECVNGVSYSANDFEFVQAPDMRLFL